MPRRGGYTQIACSLRRSWFPHGALPRSIRCAKLAPADAQALR
jgi:hypothetical protein